MVNRRKMLKKGGLLLGGGVVLGGSIFSGSIIGSRIFANDDQDDISGGNGTPYRSADRIAADKVLPAQYQKLLSLHQPKISPAPGDWLDRHEEQPQDFRKYVASRPIRVDRIRRKLYVLPVGDFDKYQQWVLEKCTLAMSIFFGLPVETLDPLGLDTIPATAKRVHVQWGDTQILTTHVLNNVLTPRLPRDACSFLALTTSDLWPGKGWNFVFGQASYRARVGVWSIYRNGDPSKSREALRLCLKRTIKTATHETGHMFSIPHCIYYQCNMNGSNSRMESDRAPLALCPHCLAKIVYATSVKPQERFEKLAEFYTSVGMPEEAEFFKKSLAAMKG